jgi:cytochrome P450
MSRTIFRWINRKTIDRLAGFPGPAPGFPTGNLMHFFGNRPWEVCAEIGREFGGASLVWFFNRPALVLNDPELIGQVLDTRSRDFYKKLPVRALKPVITSGSLFITNTGSGWDEARRDNPLSTIPYEEWLNRQIAPLRAILSSGVKSWIAKSTNTLIDLYWDMQRLMFDAFSQAFWGRTFPPDRFDWFQTLARTGNRRMNLPKPVLPPLSPWFYPAQRQWYRSFEILVAEARAKPNPTAPDLLNVALSHGTPLSDRDLAEAIATNFFGGVFSCSSTVNTALHLLAQHPAKGKKVASAVRTELTTDFERPALDACRPLEFAIREAMRFYPAVPIYFRNSSPDREVMLGKHSLPKDTMVMISNWYLHKMSPHWANPERFDPGRWSGGVAEANPYGSGYFFPFGRGPRACIGAAFGQMIHRLALATIYRESEPELDPEWKYNQSFFFGVMMPKGLTGRFRSS